MLGWSATCARSPTEEARQRILAGDVLSFGLHLEGLLTSQQVGQTLQGLMRLKEVQGDHEAALTLGRRCLALFEKLFGPESVEVVFRLLPKEQHSKDYWRVFLGRQRPRSDG